MPPSAATLTVKDGKLEGVVYKLRTTGLKAWQKRWFRFQAGDDHIAYYKTPKDEQPHNTLDLREVLSVLKTDVMPKKAPAGTGFTLHTTTGRTYYLRAPTAADTTKWVDALKPVVDELKAQRRPLGRGVHASSSYPALPNFETGSPRSEVDEGEEPGSFDLPEAAVPGGDAGADKDEEAEEGEAEGESRSLEEDEDEMLEPALFSARLRTSRRKGLDRDQDNDSDDEGSLSRDDYLAQKIAEKQNSVENFRAAIKAAKKNKTMLPTVAISPPERKEPMNRRERRAEERRLAAEKRDRLARLRALDARKSGSFRGSQRLSRTLSDGNLGLRSELALSNSPLKEDPEGEARAEAEGLPATTEADSKQEADTESRRTQEDGEAAAEEAAEEAAE